MFEDVPAVFVLMAVVMVAALIWGSRAIEALDDPAPLSDGDAD
jgi:hypothetical protein